jgi:hypothetical protein
VFADALGRFHLIALGCGGVIVISLATRAVLGPRPRRFAVRVSIAGLMLAATTWATMIVGPQIAAVQREAGARGLPSALPEGDARRTAFVRLHRVSTALELVPFVGGLALLFWELKD